MKNKGVTEPTYDRRKLIKLNKLQFQSYYFLQLIFIKTGSI